MISFCKIILLMLLPRKPSITIVLSQLQYLMIYICAFISLFISTTLADTAIAFIKPTSSNSSISGTLTIEQDISSNISLVSIRLSGLSSNQKVGFHIHAFGDVSSQDGSATGGHFNPTNASHGCIAETIFNSSYTASSPANLPTQYHVGDIGNLQADASGNVNTFVTSTLISLRGQDPGFVIGRGIVVHAQPDDCVTQPSGNAGARLAQGVIGWSMNGTSSKPPVFSPVRDQQVAQSAISYLAATASTTVNESTNRVSGQLIFSQASPDDLVIIRVLFQGLAPLTRHGLHIHEFGDISNEVNGTNTGGHFNPKNVSHGCYNNETRHAGDLGNIDSDSRGIISTTIGTSLLSLYSGSEYFVLGRGVVLHANPDDCFTQPSGNAGARLAQGVIGYRNASRPVPDVPSLSSQLHVANHPWYPGSISSTTTSGASSLLELGLSTHSIALVLLALYSLISS